MTDVITLARQKKKETAESKLFHITDTAGQQIRVTHRS